MRENQGGPIRFGIMCDGRTLRRWQAQSVQRILDLGNANLALLIVEPAGKRKIRKARFSHLFLQVYRTIFLNPPAFRSTDMSDLFVNVPTIRCKAIRRGKFSEYFDDRDLERIRSCDLDFILRFGYGILRGGILTAARYGVWSFHHDDENRYRGRPACFWEIFYNDPLTGAVLQRITERLDGGIVLRKGYFRTRNYSYGDNLQIVCSESSRWPAQVCIDIRNNHAQYLESSPSSTKARIFNRPSNPEMILFVAKLLGNRLKRLYRLLFLYSVWNIGLVEKPIAAFLTTRDKPKINWFPQTEKGEFKADPFAIAIAPNIHVFFEYLDYHRPKGIIYTVEISRENYATQPKRVIELPVHMSYPYVLEYQGETYCIPETNWAREISVYKATRFPYEWEKSGTLLKNVAAIDSTVFIYENRWWLMFTDRERGGDANLYVWHAPGLWGPWEPHVNNPVKSDVRSARPGGTPFMSNGFLYRPAQDCSQTGGGQVIINRIKKLTPTEFEEESIAVVTPDKNGPYPEGLHTLSSVGNLTLVDGKRFEFLAVALLNNIVKGIRRALDLDA